MLDRDAEAAKLKLLRININKLAGTASVRHETIVNVFPGMDDAQRLVIAVEQESDGESRLVLRQESYSEAVGWFVEELLELERVSSPRGRAHSPSLGLRVRRRWSRLRADSGFDERSIWVGADQVYVTEAFEHIGTVQGAVRRGHTCLRLGGTPTRAQ